MLVKSPSIICCALLAIVAVKANQQMTIEKTLVQATDDPEALNFIQSTQDGNVSLLTELDLAMEKDQFIQFHNPSSRTKRKAVRDSDYLWKEAQIYYEILPELKPYADLIKSAMAGWSMYTCFQFIEWPYPYQVKFKMSDKCQSRLGVQPPDKQPQYIELAPRCLQVGTIMHEIGHAVGMIHEHMRPDRDDYIEVHFDRIDELAKGNYKKYSTALIDTYNVTYDYMSIMHYGTWILGPITTRDPKYQFKIGQREYLTFGDIKLANLMYGCYTRCQKWEKCPGEGIQLYRAPKWCECYCDSGLPHPPVVLCSEKYPNTTPSTPSTSTSPSTSTVSKSTNEATTRHSSGDIQSPETPASKPDVMPNSPQLLQAFSDNQSSGFGGDSKMAGDVFPDCGDARDDCVRLKDKGYCESKVEAMLRFCPKTCDFCGKDKDLCMDRESNCAAGSKAGWCTDAALKPYMSSMCPVSCNICARPANRSEVLRVLFSERSGAGKDAVGTCLQQLCLTFTLAIATLLFFMSSSSMYLYI